MNILTVKEQEELYMGYLDNLKELKETKNQIKKYGCCDNGISDVADSYQQGFNDAFEFILGILDISF